MFGAALAYARADFLVVPCMENAREPHTTGPFRHGARSASSDYEQIRDHWYKYSDDNVGIAPDGTFVLIDVDPRNGGSLERVEAIGLPVDGYRERTVSGGWRIPLSVPPGTNATHSFEPVPGVELKARGTYALAPHSRIEGQWYRPEPGRDIWRFAAIPPQWQYLARLTADTLTTYSIDMLPEDRRAAAEVMHRLQRHSTYRSTVNAIMGGAWKERYQTRSEADIALAFHASHFLREHWRRREVLFALLEHHSLKAGSHANPGHYLSITVDKAIAHRDRIDADQHADVYHRFVAPFLPPSVHPASLPAPPPTAVYDAKFLGNRTRGPVLERVILEFAASPEQDRFSMDDRWRRLPVQIVADLFGVDRETIRLVQKSANTRGLIERAPRAKRHDGGPRMDAIIRITPKGREMLDTIREKIPNEVLS